jgi:hypothetical protein
MHGPDGVVLCHPYVLVQLTQAQQHDANDEQRPGDLQLGVPHIVKEAVREGPDAVRHHLAHAQKHSAWHHQHHHGTCHQQATCRVSTHTSS